MRTPAKIVQATRSFETSTTVGGSASVIALSSLDARPYDILTQLVLA